MKVEPMPGYILAKPLKQKDTTSFGILLKYSEYSDNVAKVVNGNGTQFKRNQLIVYTDMFDTAIDDQLLIKEQDIVCRIENG